MRRSLRLAVRASAVQSAPQAADGAEVAADKAAKRRTQVKSAAKRKREEEAVAAQGSGVVKVESSQLAASVELKEEKNGPEKWEALCSTRELSCKLTLTSGQVFSWRKIESSDPECDGGVEWMGIIGHRVFSLRERDGMVECRVVFPSDVPCKAMIEELTRYFRLDMEAVPLYQGWTTKDDRMARIISTLPGLRIVRQDPVECLFSFICSSNNNIQRIQQMVDKLRLAYGKHLFTSNSPKYSCHAFPTVESLATKCEEDHLRELGFGYRAPFIIKSAQQLQALGGSHYLAAIRDENAKALAQVDVPFDGSYQEQLMVFSGVGRKVADCVALFSLERLDAIPVDTHVWQIACREFDPTLSNKKSITPSVYQSVGDHFRSRFAPFAGWAHSVLFAGDLSAFQPLLVDIEGVKSPTKRAKKVEKVASTSTKPAAKRKPRS